MHRPLIITMGDPTGVGPELIVKALLAGALDNLPRPLVIAGDAGVLRRAARLFGVTAQSGSAGQRRHRYAPAHLRCSPSRRAAPVGAGGRSVTLRCPEHRLRPGHARLRDLELRPLPRRVAAGMVTAPISKAAIHQAGCHFPGHTELLAERCGVEKVVMMLGGDRLKVCLVTTHLALRDVPSGPLPSGDLQYPVDHRFRIPPAFRHRPAATGGPRTQSPRRGRRVVRR